jgi:putative hydrolase of the HAD superfamily
MDRELERAPGPRTVVFDLGGVVCRFFPARRLGALARASGCSAAEVHLRLFASGFDHDCDGGRYDLEQQCAQICARLGVSWDESVLAELWAQTFEPDTDVLAVLVQVRARAGTALLTNNSPLVHLIIQNLLPDVAAHFDQLCFSYQVGALKPDPRAYVAALERLRISAGQCVLVDDAEQNVEGARAVGIDAFCFVSADALASEFDERGLL